MKTSVMEDMESQLAIFCQHTRLPAEGLGYTQLVVGQHGPIEIPKQPRLLLRKRVTFHKLTVGSQCQRQHSVSKEGEIELLPT